MPTSSASPPRPPLVVEEIKAQLAERIGRQWCVGDRLPPLRVLARELGVGQRNTFMAVQDLVRSGILMSRPRRGTFVAPPRRPAKSSTSKSRTTKTGHHKIVVPLAIELEAFHHLMMRAFKDRMQHYGHEVQELHLERERMRDWRDVDATGLALINFDEGHRLQTRPDQVAVHIDTVCRPITTPGVRYDVVGPDERQGALLAGQALRSLGVRDVAYLGAGKRTLWQYYAWEYRRLEGLEAGLGFTIPRARQLMCKSYVLPHAAVTVPTYMAMSPRPLTVFASTDDLALGFMTGAAALGLAAGRDYRLVGFDGQMRGRYTPFGALATVVVPAVRMAHAGADFLASRLARPDQPSRIKLLPCAFFAGNTMGPATVPPPPGTPMVALEDLD